MSSHGLRGDQNTWLSLLSGNRTSATTAANESLTYDQIVLIGDSLTEWGGNRPGGWGLLLTQHYSRRLNVNIRGFGSFNTWWLKFTISPLFHSLHNVKLITLMIGTNDYAELPNGRHVPIEKYRTFLGEIISNLHTVAPHAHILVMTPPPMCAFEAGTHLYKNALLYRAACTEAVESFHLQSWSHTHLALLNTWDVFLPSKEYENPDFDPSSEVLKQFFVDDLHLNVVGNERLFEGVVTGIARAWPHLAVEKLKDVVTNADEVLGPPAVEGDEEAVRRWLGLK
ncbi:hypothetical protein HDU98_008269 [Podochytrium sp. JEL0797]|nr:hypothetical protein HDU98_008269 [Podochytrium sp. JEL0797]